MKKVEHRIRFDEDAAVLLHQLAGGSHKLGEYLSELIRQTAKGQTVEARIRALEQELARLKADVGVAPDEEHDG